MMPINEWSNETIPAGNPIGETAPNPYEQQKCIHGVSADEDCDLCYEDEVADRDNTCPDCGGLLGGPHKTGCPGYPR